MQNVLAVSNIMLELSGKRILDDVSFSLQKGSLTALLGTNGAGKSQLLRCIKGLKKAKSGKICIDGAEADERARMKRIALVFQSAEMQIVSQSVEKDVAFGPENMGLDEEEIERRVSDALSVMNLEDKRKQRPQTLSGGEMRKCAIAGILAMEPDVILLDEPFANLDYPSTCLMIKALISLKERGFTILAVSHEAEKFLFHTDNILIMKDGRIVKSGASSSLYKVLPEYGIYIPENAHFEDLSWLV